MFKQGDKITLIRPTFTQRRRKETEPGDGEWITEKCKDKVVNGVIAFLDRLYIPVTLEDKSIRQILHGDLTFGKGNKVSFASKLPDRHKMIKQPDGSYKEINAIGKAIVITGKVFLRDVYIPVLIDDEIIQTPYHQITFSKEKK